MWGQQGAHGKAKFLRNRSKKTRLYVAKFALTLSPKSCACLGNVLNSSRCVLFVIVKLESFDYILISFKYSIPVLGSKVKAKQCTQKTKPMKPHHRVPSSALGNRSFTVAVLPLLPQAGFGAHWVWRRNNLRCSLHLVNPSSNFSDSSESFRVLHVVFLTAFVPLKHVLSLIAFLTFIFISTCLKYLLITFFQCITHFNLFKLPSCPVPILSSLCPPPNCKRYISLFPII